MTLPVVRLIRGQQPILHAQPMLAELARRTGQAGEMDSLGHFLSTPDAVKKTPALVLIGNRTGHDGLYLKDLARPTGNGIVAALWLFEYTVGLGGTRIFATSDASGRRSLIAPASQRARIAALAARSLVELGASIVHIAFSETHSNPFDAGAAGDPDHLLIPPPEHLAAGSTEQIIASELRLAGRATAADWALVEQHMPLYLPLYPTFDETLSHIGQRTRANLRYYRRRAEHGLGATFVPNVEISRREFLLLNSRSMYAVPEKIASWRFHSLASNPNSFLRGVRDAEGNWISLVGGRRQRSFAELDWQMNRADRASYSPATVMRSYLIEHEIALGSRRLYIEGGTPQAIGRSFAHERVEELTVKRRNPYVKLIEKLAPRMAPARNYLAQTLQNPTIQWKAW